MLKKIIRLRWAIFLIVAGLFIWPLLLFPHREPIKALQMQSDFLLQGVSKVMLVNKNASNETSPQSLKELVPDSFSINGSSPLDLRSFDLQYRQYFKQTSDKNNDHDIVDRYYNLSAIPGVLAYEKAGLWPDDSIAVCFSDLRVRRLTATEFAALGKK